MKVHESDCLFIDIVDELSQDKNVLYRYYRLY